MSSASSSPDPLTWPADRMARLLDMTTRQVDKLPMEEICARLKMETEEVVRLAARVGIPKSKIITDAKWSKSWVPQ